MGKLITALKRLPKRTSAIAAIILAAVVVPATLFAWGPGRDTFTEQNPAPYVTFNSITNNSFYGDERNFVTVKDASNTQDGGWTDKVTVQPGKEYVVRMYVHNNAADHLNLKAINTRASASIGTATGKSVPISGFVSADNAEPKKVWDDVELASDKDFNLAYVPGSATWHNNFVGKNPQGAKLPDSIVTSTGALLGTESLNGEIPGCYKYSGYVYFKVKPQFAGNPDFTTSKLVSKKGENKWVENYQAQPGETVDYLINYKNTGDTQQDNVHVKDTLPKDMTYVAGSTVLGNASNPSGIKTNDGVTTTGLNIGSYKPGANAWIIFSAKVPALENLACGENKLRNVARVTSVGYYKEDDANVTVPKECQPECKYSCDALKVDELERTKFKFSVTTTEENATFKKVTYVIRNEQGTEIERKESNAKTYEYTRTQTGKYTVEAIVTFTVNGVEKTATSANCKKPFEVKEEPVTPVYRCDSLNVTKLERTKFKFATQYFVEHATLKSIVYVIRDAEGKEIARQTSADYEQTTVGKYSVEAIVTVTVNGQDKVAPGNCKAEFEVVKEKTPAVSIDKKVDGVEHKKVGVDQEFTYQIVVKNTGETDLTNAVVSDKAPNGVTFLKASAGTIAGNAWNHTIGSLKVGESTSFTITAKVPSYLAGKIVNTACVDSPEIPGNPDDCDDASIEVPKTPEEPCVPGKDAECTETPETPEVPTELPKTGAADGIVALLGAGSLIAAIGYYIASRRALS